RTFFLHASQNPQGLCRTPPLYYVVVDVFQALLLVAERQHGLVTRAQAMAKGLTAGAIRGRLNAGAWERVHAAVYLVAGSGKTWKQSLMAGLLGGRPGVRCLAPCRRETLEASCRAGVGRDHGH